MPLSPGAAFGRFEIVSLAGRGGMGEVYQARETTLGRLVALKTIRSAALLDSDSKAAARFEREARLLAAFTHPNAVTIYGLETIEDTLVLVMEWVDGATLREPTTATSAIDERLRWLGEAASALAALHAQGIVHRDLKPANMMIDKTGRLRLLDFGIAKALGQAPSDLQENLTGTYDVIGTPRDMAPEQRSSASNLDARVDQYAWGVVAFEMLGGRLLRDVLVEVEVDKSLPPPSESERIRDALKLRVDDRVARTIARALSFDPNDRFPTMMELVAELSRESGTKTLAGRSSPRGRSPQRASRRSNLRVFLGSVAAALVVGVGAALALVSGPLKKPAAPVPTVLSTPVHVIAPPPPESSAPEAPPSASVSASASAAPPPQKPPLRNYRDVALVNVRPKNADAIRAWFAPKKLALLKCYRAEPILRKCPAMIDELGFNCRMKAGVVEHCALATTTGTNTEGCSGRHHPECFESALQGHSSPVVSDDEEWMYVEFHPLE